MLSKTMIRVISMHQAAQRREQFSEAAAQAGIEWAFFDALATPELPLVHSPESTLIRTGRSLRPGEIGCYASHYSVWRQFLASDAQQLMVFEDDVLVDWPAIRLIADKDLAAAGIHVLKLFATYPIQYHATRYKFYSDHSHLVRVRGYCYGTQAYVLTRTAAAALVECCGVLDMPIDWAMSRYWAYGYTNYAVMPYPIIERLGTSSIGHPPASHVDVSAAAIGRRLLWRISDRLRRAVTDLGRRSEPQTAAATS